MATALADETWAARWPTPGLKAGEFPVRQQRPQAPKAGPHEPASSEVCTANWRATTRRNSPNPPNSHSHSGSRCRPRCRPRVDALRVGSPCEGTGPCTRRSAMAARTTPGGRPPNPACGATVCTGRSTPAPLGRSNPSSSPSSSSRPLTRAPRPSSPFARRGCPPPPRPAACRLWLTRGRGGGEGVGAQRLSSMVWPPGCKTCGPQTVPLSPGP